MILIHIVTESKQQADEITEFLINEKLILNAFITEDLFHRKKTGEEISNVKSVLIMGKTKALLFNTIDELLREKYPNNMPTLFSIPIVHMDWEQADELVKETAKV